MTTKIGFAQGLDTVNPQLSSTLFAGVAELEAAVVAGESARQIEKRVWALVLALGRTLLAWCFGLRCAYAAQAYVEEEGIDPASVKLRCDSDYWATVTTTMGSVKFPMFALRIWLSTWGTKTVTGHFRQAFPLYRRCRSSELCLEFETWLATEMPYREAQKALTFFTHGPVTLEDTTIARHACTVGQLIDRRWLFQPSDRTAGVLRERATRDRVSGRPLVYVSCDAHALRRYVNESWTPGWKMLNGMWVWARDAKTGRLIHLGGQFVWGNADSMRDEFKALIDEGILPADGRYADDVVAQYVFVTDGMPWLADKLLPLLEGAVAILDVYHLLERVAAYLRTRKGIDGPVIYEEIRQFLTGRPAGYQARRTGARLGHKKGQRRSRPHPKLPPQSGQAPIKAIEEAHIIESIMGDLAIRGPEEQSLLNYFSSNSYRMSYRYYRSRGYQIGSGAMESFHRIASQVRLKRPGATWLPETSQALLTLRLLRLAGRWNEYWDQPDLAQSIGPRFKFRNFNTHRGPWRIV